MKHTVYAKPVGCVMNKVFINVIMSLCAAASIISVLQKIQVKFSFRNKGLILYNVF